jgi:hypothetical protein
MKQETRQKQEREQKQREERELKEQRRRAKLKPRVVNGWLKGDWKT